MTTNTTRSNLKEKGKNVLDKALGEIVTPIVNILDVDGLVQQVDIDEVVQKIDINALLDKVDVNSLLAKVDINALIERSNLEAIVAKSSSGVFTGIIDTLRFQIVRADLCLLKTFQFGKAVLPPAPGMVDTLTPFPKTITQKAVAMQLHYSGIFSKTIAIGFDAALLFLVQTVFTLTIQAALQRINKLLIQWDPIEDLLDKDELIASSILNLSSTFCYFWIAIALTGRTIGMAIVGILVVNNSNGDKDVTILQAALRTIGLVGTIFCWPFTILVGLFRRDGRMPHDVLARTGVIFQWNARMARLREENIDDDNNNSTVSSHQGSSMNAQQGSNAESQSTNADSDNSDTSSNRDIGISENAKPNNATEKSEPKTNANAKNASKSVPTTNAAPGMSSKGKSVCTDTKTNTVTAKKVSVTNVPRTIELSPALAEDGSEKSTLSAMAPPLEKAAMSVSVPHTVSRLRQVLDEGRGDLQNVKPPGIVGLFFNPVRTLVLDPSLAIASVVVPPIVSVVPFADGIAANTVRIPFEIAKAGYGLLPFQEDNGNMDLALFARENILCTTANVSETAPHMSWTDSFQTLLKIAHSLGITLSDDETLARDCDNGRLSDDLMILEQIQVEFTRQKLIEKESQSQIQCDINEGSRMAKYATAAYGIGMCQCNIDRDSGCIQNLSVVKKELARYVDIDEDDIKLICLSSGESGTLLRHFVAIDRERTSVTLAISGSLSSSSNGTQTSMRADETDFCTVKAHKGLSQIANNIWNVSGSIIVELLAQLESQGEWRFIITGHSLGAGAGALLALKIHVQGLLGNRQITCRGFAIPPVYRLDERQRDPAALAAIETAIASTICYIHGNDCVPFLTQESMSVLADRIKIVDDACKGLWHRDRESLASGRMPIPQVLVHEVERDDRTPNSVGFVIPASKCVWMKRDQSSGEFSAFACLPGDLANLDIRVSANMISDGFPYEYEVALAALAT